MVYFQMKTYNQVFGSLDMPIDEKAKLELNMLETQGWTERGICYAAQRSFETLCNYRRSKHFWSMFRSAVNRWALKAGDPRWDEINKRKTQKELDEKRQENTHRKLLTLDRLGKSKKKCKTSIYFIQGENGGPIKIGFAKNINNRLVGIQTGNPDNIVLLAAMPGTSSDEAELHKAFSEYRVRGEWFSPAKELIDFIDKLNKDIYSKKK